MPMDYEWNVIKVHVGLMARYPSTFIHVVYIPNIGKGKELYDALNMVEGKKNR